MTSQVVAFRIEILNDRLVNDKKLLVPVIIVSRSHDVCLTQRTVLTRGLPAGLIAGSPRYTFSLLFDDP